MSIKKTVQRLASLPAPVRLRLSVPREYWDTRRTLQLLINQIERVLELPVLGDPYLVIKRRGKIPVTRCCPDMDHQEEWMLTETMNPSMEGVVCFTKKDAALLAAQIPDEEEPYVISRDKYLRNWKARLNKAIQWMDKLDME